MDRLLETYLEREATLDEMKQYYTFVSLSGYLWTYWTIFKEASGLNFGSYGMIQYGLSKLYYNKAVSIKTNNM